MIIIARYLAGVCVVLWLVSGCSVLPAPEPVAMDQFILEVSHDAQSIQAPGPGAPVLLVTTPRAHGGYDTPRIAYMQQVYGLRYYTRSHWADTPARMLAPLIADAMQRTGQFQALYASPGLIAADLRLDTELIRFHQDFTRQPSEVRITLRAQLMDLDSNRVVETRQFDISGRADTDDAYGGVVAINKAVEQLLQELSRFCVDSRR
jgi:cholesterol transport system auxiliary component